MTLTRIVKAASPACAAVIFTVVSASAATITYNTNATGAGGTNFNGVTNQLVLNSTSGPAASLTYTPNGNTTNGVPSNVNFGDFLLACAACSTQNAAVPNGSNFSAFTFNLVLTDITDNAKGTFVGSSTGGMVFSDVSGLTINWSPLQLGPGASGATSGNFGTSTFTIGSPTRIVAPNSGSPAGDTTV